jgi:hypothetical protein
MTSLISSPIDDEFRLLAEVLRAPVTTAWDAVHTPTGRRARVTVLSPPAPASPRVVTAMADAFRESVERARRWQGADTLPVNEIYEGDGLPYAVTFLPDGVLLEEWLEAQVPLTEALTVGSRLGQALARAHESGLSHGCLRPSTVFLDRGLRPRLLEFALHAGAARAAREAGLPVLVENPTGTVGAGRGEDEWAADQRALAVILLQVLSGTRLEALRLAELASRLPAELPSSLRESIGRALTEGGEEQITPRALATHLAFDAAWLQALEPVTGSLGPAQPSASAAAILRAGVSGDGRRPMTDQGPTTQAPPPGLPEPAPTISRPSQAADAPAALPPGATQRTVRPSEHLPCSTLPRRLVQLGLVLMALIVALVVGIGARSVRMAEALPPPAGHGGDWIVVQVGPLADQGSAASIHHRLRPRWPGALVRFDAGRYWVQVTTSAWPYRARAAARRLRAQGFEVRTVLQH